MYIKITVNTVCDGQAVDAGAVVDASDKEARTLMGMGKAIETDRPKPPKPGAAAVTPKTEKAVAPKARRRSKR